MSKVKYLSKSKENNVNTERRWKGDKAGKSKIEKENHRHPLWW